jgi:anaerobic selenocysteine-containing dehydrogenase
MGDQPKTGWIERFAEQAGLIERLAPPAPPKQERLAPEGELEQYPPMERWGDWADPEPGSTGADVSRRYTLIPTICFNCEAACGLLAYVDKERLEVRKFEGNPMHPGSRGRNCAKGPATINQIRDPDRILYPLKRVGPRGSGQWERVSWDAALDDLASRIRHCLESGKQNEVMYHVGRPGYEGSVERVLRAWGIDGHNSHTNVCSASARLGYHLWQGSDRPSPDHERSRFMLLMSAHLEAGHYFNPHAQRIIQGKLAGAKLAVIDPRLSIGWPPIRGPKTPFCWPWRTSFWRKTSSTAVLLKPGSTGRSI